MAFEYVRLRDRAIRQVCSLCLFITHIKGAKIRFRLRQTTLSDTTVDCQHVCVSVVPRVLFSIGISLLVKHQNDNTVPQ